MVITQSIHLRFALPVLSQHRTKFSAANRPALATFTRLRLAPSGHSGNPHSAMAPPVAPSSPSRPSSELRRAHPSCGRAASGISHPLLFSSLPLARLSLTLLLATVPFARDIAQTGSFGLTAVRSLSCCTSRSLGVASAPASLRSALSQYLGRNSLPGRLILEIY